MRFTKMEGLGNDYVYVDGFSESVADPEGLARRISDRHFGVGSDGLILILPSDQADLRMEMWNSDGSKSEMCGNGLRCVGYYAFAHGLVRKPQMVVETGAGLLSVEVVEETGPGAALVRMQMGAPRLERGEIPMLGAPGRVVDEPFEVAGATFRVTAVSMGNPHAVIPVENVREFPVERFGPMIEHDSRFPRRVNVEFVETLSKGEVIQRTWERGAGETMACGTGAAAVAVAGVLSGRNTSPMRIHLNGGDLFLEWDGAGGPVIQTGPARIVYTGDWPDHPAVPRNA